MVRSPLKTFQKERRLPLECESRTKDSPKKKTTFSAEMQLPKMEKCIHSGISAAVVNDSITAVTTLACFEWNVHVLLGVL